LVHSLFLFPVFHLGSAAYLPISTAPADLRYVFYLFIVASVLNVGAGFLASRRGERERGRLLLGAALLGLGCIHYALSRFDGGHVINTALISIGLLPLSLFVLLSAITRKLALSFTAVASTLIVFVGVQFLLPRYTRYFYRGIRVEMRLDQPRQVANTADLLEPGDKGIFVKQNGRSFPLGRMQTAEATSQMLREVERASTPGQLLLVGPGDLRRTVGCDTYIYHMLPQLRPATYYLEMNPGSTNAPGSRLAGDVERADWLVLDRGWDSINEPNQSSEFGSDAPNKVVQAKFDLWAEYGPYMILRNRRLRNFVQPLRPQ